MSEKKNIDKLFKEQFKDFEVTPDDAIWKNIEQELHKDKRKRRIIPIWLKIAGVAALLALLFTVGQGVFNNDNNAIKNNPIVDSKSNTDTNASEGRNASNANAQNDSDNSQNANPSEQSDFSSKNGTQERVATTETNSDSLKTIENASEAASNGNQQSSEETQGSTAVVSNKDGEASTTRNALANASEEKAEPKKSAGQSENAVAQQQTLPQKEARLKSAAINQTEAIAQSQKPMNPEAKLAVENSDAEDSKSNALVSKENTASKIRIAAFNPEAKNNLETLTDNLQNQEENAIETAIALANDPEDLEDEDEAQQSKWSVSPNVAPVYFNSLGNSGSSLDAQFANNSKQGDVNVSYGIKGSYAINKKLKIRAGMNKVDLGYRTNNVLIFDSANTLGRSQTSLSNIELNAAESNNSFLSAKNVTFASAPDILFSKEQVSLDQNLGFIEVPIEIEYSVLNTKLGLNLIGGFSTFFLNNNEIFSVETNGNQTLMGEATNVNDLSYSANFGIGLDYELSKKLKVNLEPTFKYQLNTFNNTSGDFQPFFIGVYTGLSFKF
ncbi:hypothetical protein ESY86_07640 [Subsaximicrobium wynnwilliamsii]|uniref:Outer membrane beta-barrel protein n=1 Tax=Subsaximicrobium wynnwilliamsii TaxID=291179 RepID=A0A5C6ZJA6_9FLAO|nr:hypothetical protein [Subsaximicrobium wynnwilliamsii]TXD83909.1 hypothetical protein ESY87_07805 [Subsaximicrobium wynnwilliamsii]TXD89649.1 hypothetical protein ESY86_07640 [Subsaximicrobium wynnwilliamsii]TXE02559.1 hypothetical protein ESY88_11200 [Subsaximicrobium wynnwilliamsii]